MTTFLYAVKTTQAFDISHFNTMFNDCPSCLTNFADNMNILKTKESQIEFMINEIADGLKGFD